MRSNSKKERVTWREGDAVYKPPADSQETAKPAPTDKEVSNANTST